MVKNYLFGLPTRKKININEEIINIRTTNAICNKNSFIRMKERLTLSNIGTNDSNSFTEFTTKNTFSETNIYHELKNNILIVFLHNKISSVEDLMNLKFLGAYNLNFNEFPLLFKTQIEKDFQEIKKVIENKTFITSTQQYIHIHKHGNKYSETRALGLKNNFVSKIIEIELLKEKYQDWQQYLDNQLKLYLDSDNINIKISE